MLVTTGEEAAAPGWHAAVSRPGRCAVQTEFRPRPSRPEGGRGLRLESSQGRDTPGPAKGTLASLFAGDAARAERPKIGFAS